MTFDPILSTSPVIQLHLLAALVAVILAPLQIWRDRRDHIHRAGGYVWVTAMAALALTALFIPSFGLAVVGPYGPIHILVPITLVGLWRAVCDARAGRIEAHRRGMRSLAFGALGVAGLFTFMPDRIMGQVLFGGRPSLAWSAIVLGLILLAVVALRDRARRAVA
ncbi:DUF2306 domain-containing protein [Histidinibacterium aquaticum]|uniref:DUF2306 domain-containing protein n=1 Tax=Histidinibacterium aquaticum TaxID=2613962 RepID=A0A5J5GRF8_9RHOB|nr:DUF2306 domain-containing protein [Histidinibacterium aquaticum]KAA9010114.1 DUF2306 domain-containing protein [Histidinibacterium aquaticum]